MRLTYGYELFYHFCHYTLSKGGNNLKAGLNSTSLGKVVALRKAGINNVILAAF